MLIVYDTFTGKVKKFTEKLPSNIEVRHISEYDGTSLYYFITSTIDFGKLLSSTYDFLLSHSDNCLGVSSSGNKIWGRNYAKAADLISEKYNVPIISKFELDGTEDDVKYFVERIMEIEYNRNK